MTLKVALLSVVNGTDLPIFVQVTRLESGVSFSRQFAAQSTQTLDLSTRNIHLRTTPVPDPSAPPVLAVAGLAVAIRCPA